MTPNRIPLAELERRHDAARRRMVEAGLDAILVLQNADLFYLTGSIQAGVLYLPADGPAAYLVRRDLARARAESPLERVLPLRSPKDLPALLADAGLPLPARAGMELDVVPVALYDRYRKALPGCELKDASGLLRAIRAVKSPYELAIQAEAAVVAARIVDRARAVLRPGITEIELSAEIEHAARLAGHQGITRMRAFNAELNLGHAMGGPGAAEPSYADTPLGGTGPGPAVPGGAGHHPIAAGEPVILDVAPGVGGYLVDQTRTLCIGPLSPSLARAYADMVAVQERMVELARPGASCGRIYEECRALAERLGHAADFMGAAGSQVPFIGHGVGIELDELPLLARGFDASLLEEGMVFAFEPKAVYPGIGAVGVENTWVVTADGVRRLTLPSDDLIVV